MTRKQPSHARPVVTKQQLTGEIVRARAQRAAAAALRAESRQAQRRARALVESSNAILDSAMAITKGILERRGILLAEPLRRAFRWTSAGARASRSPSD